MNKSTETCSWIFLRDKTDISQTPFSHNSTNTLFEFDGTEYQSLWLKIHNLQMNHKNLTQDTLIQEMIAILRLAGASPMIDTIINHSRFQILLEKPDSTYSLTWKSGLFVRKLFLKIQGRPIFQSRADVGQALWEMLSALHAIYRYHSLWSLYKPIWQSSSVEFDTYTYDLINVNVYRILKYPISLRNHLLHDVAQTDLGMFRAAKSIESLTGTKIYLAKSDKRGFLWMPLLFPFLPQHILARDHRPNARDLGTLLNSDVGSLALMQNRRMRRSVIASWLHSHYIRYFIVTSLITGVIYGPETIRYFYAYPIFREVLNEALPEIEGPNTQANIAAQVSADNYVRKRAIEALTELRTLDPAAARTQYLEALLVQLVIDQPEIFKGTEVFEFVQKLIPVYAPETAHENLP